MSSAALVNLPEEFLLHIQSSRKEPWSHYVLVRKTTGVDGKARLALSPYTTILVPPEEPPRFTTGSTVYVSDSTLKKLPLVSTDNAILLLASFKRCMTATVQIHTNAATPKTLPILYTSKYRSLLGKGLRANFTHMLPAVASPSPPPVASPPTVASPSQATVTSPPPPPPIITIPSPTTTPSLALSTIEHVDPPAAPKKAKKPHKTPAAAAANKGDLAPFVAKQLLALAQIRHDECPIIAEEYSEGNTAAMPCGHLFAQIAIEESFKKEPNKCPACRAFGRPTYV